MNMNTRCWASLSICLSVYMFHHGSYGVKFKKYSYFLPLSIKMLLLCVTATCFDFSISHRQATQYIKHKYVLMYILMFYVFFFFFFFFFCNTTTRGGFCPSLQAYSTPFYFQSTPSNSSPCVPQP